MVDFPAEIRTWTPPQYRYLPLKLAYFVGDYVLWSEAFLRLHYLSLSLCVVLYLPIPFN